MNSKLFSIVTTAVLYLSWFVNVSNSTPVFFNFASNKGQQLLNEVEIPRIDNIDNIAKLIKSGVNVNYQNMSGESALTIAACKGRVEIVELLLSNDRIDVNLQTEDGMTALMYAAWNRNGPIVQLLLRHPDIEIDLSNKYAQTALSIAKKMGHGSIMGMIQDTSNEDFSVLSDENEPNSKELKLLEEIEIGNICKMGILIRSGANVNFKDEDGQTALMKAAQNDRSEIVSALLEMNPNININAIDNYKMSALMYAAWSNSVKIVQILLNRPDINACQKNDHGQTIYQVAARRDLNAEIKNLVHQRFLNDVASGKLETVKEHIESGADVSVKNELGQNSLIIAALKDNSEMVNLLYEMRPSEINIFSQDKFGNTALMYAALNNNMENVVKQLNDPTILLVINFKNFRQQTASQLTSDPEIKRLLLEAEAKARDEWEDEDLQRLSLDSYLSGAT